MVTGIGTIGVIFCRLDPSGTKFSVSSLLLLELGLELELGEVFPAVDKLDSFDPEDGRHTEIQMANYNLYYKLQLTHKR